MRFFSEIIGQSLAEGFVWTVRKLFQYTGVTLKWAVYLERKSFPEILGESWNHRLGLFFGVLIAVGIWLLMK